ncbi:MAG: IclR family transcriptional regulator [Rhodobacteraceae bacterium]|nr:IclR family transcriptional regulator [Paracoccaceae bacterium]
MAEPRRRGRPRAFHDRTAENTVQSLDRALTILAALAEAGGIGLSALAQRLDQAPATVYRALTTLEGHGMAELDPATQAWHVGPRAFLIGSAFLRRSSVVERARPVLRALMEATGETANLGIARGDEVLFLSQVETHASIRAFFPPGTVAPLHASGIGKALLAHFDEARLAAYLGRVRLERFTPATLADPAALRADLAATRARGYALDNEERTEGMRCVAAAVLDALGEPVAGLSVSGPAARLTGAVAERIGGTVAAAAARLSEGLGARPAAAG